MLIALAALSILATVFDLRTRRVPFTLTLAACGLAICAGWPSFLLGMAVAVIAFACLRGRVGGADLVWSAALSPLSLFGVSVGWVLLFVVILLRVRASVPGVACLSSSALVFASIGGVLNAVNG